MSSVPYLIFIAQIAVANKVLDILYALPKLAQKTCSKKAQDIKICDLLKDAIAKAEQALKR